MALRAEVRERRRREWCDCERGAVPSKGRCDLEAGCCHPRNKLDCGRGTRRCPIPFPGSLGRRSVVPLRCAPWRRHTHKCASYDLRRAPRDHPDFDSNALCGGFVPRFLSPHSISIDPGSPMSIKTSAIGFLELPLDSNFRLPTSRTTPGCFRLLLAVVPGRETGWSSRVAKRDAKYPLALRASVY